MLRLKVKGKGDVDGQRENGRLKVKWRRGC